MTVNKRNKYSRMRGTHTHGGGAKKKRRGAGHRGGKGMAGSGKRADQKKPSVFKKYGNAYFGKVGFNRPQKVIKKINAVNLGEIVKKLDLYLQAKLITKEKDVYVVDVSKLGYNKVLGTGEVNVKLKIKADKFSKNAVEKIKESGGLIESENVSDQ